MTSSATKTATPETDVSPDLKPVLRPIPRYRPWDRCFNQARPFPPSPLLFLEILSGGPGADGPRGFKTARHRVGKRCPGLRRRANARRRGKRSSRASAPCENRWSLARRGRTVGPRRAVGNPMPATNIRHHHRPLAKPLIFLRPKSFTPQTPCNAPRFTPPPASAITLATTRRARSHAPPDRQLRQLYLQPRPLPG